MSQASITHRVNPTIYVIEDKMTDEELGITVYLSYPLYLVHTASFLDTSLAFFDKCMAEEGATLEHPAIQAMDSMIAILTATKESHNEA